MPTKFTKKDLLPDKLLKTLKKEGMELVVEKYESDIYYTVKFKEIPEPYNVYTITLSAEDYCGGVLLHARDILDVMECLWHQECECQRPNGFIIDELRENLQNARVHLSDDEFFQMQTALLQAEDSFINMLEEYIATERKKANRPTLYWDWDSSETYTK
jgi:hypothetical protein